MEESPLMEMMHNMKENLQRIEACVQSLDVKMEKNLDEIYTRLRNVEIKGCGAGIHHQEGLNKMTVEIDKVKVELSTLQIAVAAFKVGNSWLERIVWLLIMTLVGISASWLGK